MYKIFLDFGNKGKNGLKAVYVVIEIGKMKKKINIGVKVGDKPTSLELGLINKKKEEIRAKLVKAELNEVQITRHNFLEIIEERQIGSHVTLRLYCDKLMQNLENKFSANTLKQMNAAINRVNEAYPDLAFNEINLKLLNDLEVKLRSKTKKIGEEEIKVSSNYVSFIMKMLLSVLNKAVDEDLIERSQFDKYKKPLEKYDIEEYLTDEEVNRLFEMAKILDKVKQNCAYYFLLSCYTGLRLSDLKTFDKTKIKEGKVLLRATKNKKIISIRIHSRLQDIIDYVLENPLMVSEQKFRENIKKIMPFIGVINRNIKIHSARHTFGMMLSNMGMKEESIAKLLGDSPLVARRYAQITNERLDNEIKELFD